LSDKHYSRRCSLVALFIIFTATACKTVAPSVIIPSYFEFTRVANRLTNSIEHFLVKLTVAQLTRNPPLLMEPQHSLQSLQKLPDTASYYTHINLVHNLIYYCFKIHFNIILPFTHMFKSFVLPLSFKLLDRNLTLYVDFSSLT
jgi:hypothetical protein